MKFTTTFFSTLLMLVTVPSVNSAGHVVTQADDDDQVYFQRISTFNICEQIDPTCNTDIATNAETVWYYENKVDNTFRLVYSNSESENIGFVDISDPTNPIAIGEVPLGGEPTTVRVIGNYAVVGVNTSPDFVNPTGKLTIVDTRTQSIVREIELPGQPDAVDATSVTLVESNDYNGAYYIVVAIENERDEDLGDGAPPQAPPGFLSIIDIPNDTSLDDPDTWTIRTIDLANTEKVNEKCLYPDDPEPEYVAINSANDQVVMSLQENNCFLIFDLQSGDIVKSFTFGAVDIASIDTIEDSCIKQNESLTSVLREPDGVAWVGDTGYFASANEGDLDGGSRGWTIFDPVQGSVVWDSGNALELEAVRVGHYPESRSENKGNEPENVFYSKFGNGKAYIFVLAERSNVVFVYDVTGENVLLPILLQTLPAGVGPEGVTVIPSLNLLIVADEVDNRDDKIRSSLTIYQLGPIATSAPAYPTLVSGPREGGAKGVHIPFLALSGLASAAPFGLMDNDKSIKSMKNILYSTEDSYYKKSRIFTIDASSFPAIVIGEKRIIDSTNVLKDCLTTFKKSNESENSEVDISSLINEGDKTVNIDPEGIAVSKNGGFWIVSEGRGTIGDEDRPIESPNLLLKTNDDGEITQCILLPLGEGEWPPQFRFGFEGVAEDDNHVVVAVQRAWGDDPNPRLAIYNTDTEIWSYLFYPLDEPESQNGGWVGTGDIASVGNGQFLVLERDNQGGPDAVIKRVYSINLGDYSFEDGITIEKTFFRDLIPDLKEGNGSVLEKVEGLAVTQSGQVYINTDNDGVDDSSGEQQFLNVGTYNGGGSITSNDDEDVEGTTTGNVDVDIDDSSSSSSSGNAAGDVDIDDSSSSGNAVSFDERIIVLIAIVSTLSAIFAVFTEN